MPPKVDGRLDTRDAVLRSAEFHGCDFDFAPRVNACVEPATAEALGRVRFTVRDRPERGTLPPREDTAKQFVSLISRDARFEATGRVDEVRNVAFHQRDDNDDGEADGTLGALVDAGTGGAFDAVIDDESDVLDPDDDTEPFTVLGKGTTKMRIGVECAAADASARACDPTTRRRRPTPTRCRPTRCSPPCDRDDVLGRSSGQLAGDAAVDPVRRVEQDEGQRADRDRGARQGRRGPAEDDPADLQPLDERLRDDRRQGPVVAAHRRHRARHAEARRGPAVAGRKLEMDYKAAQRIDRIDFEMQARRAGSLCEDPRPNRRATCLIGRADRPAVGHLDVL